MHFKKNFSGTLSELVDYKTRVSSESSDEYFQGDAHNGYFQGNSHKDSKFLRIYLGGSTPRLRIFEEQF